MAIAGIAYAIGKAKEEAEKAHQEALDALEDAKTAQQQITDLANEMDD